MRFWKSCATVDVSGRGYIAVVDGWFEFVGGGGGGNSGDSGIGESWRQSSIGWGPRELWRCGRSWGPSAHPDQSAKAFSGLDEIARHWVSGLQYGVVCRQLFLRAG